MKIRVEMNEIENRKQRKKSMKQTAGSLKNFSSDFMLVLVRLAKIERKHKSQISNTKQRISLQTLEIKKLRECYENFTLTSL